MFIIALSNKKDLAEQLQYLKAENEILRARLPKHIKTTRKERSILLKYGKPLGTAIKSLISIVTPQTFSRWIREEDKYTSYQPSRRRRTPEQIRTLVLRIARETGWGYTRILGELRKLGIRKICRSTIVNILHAHYINPSPKRAGSKWKEYIKRHAESLYACDFFTKKVWTPLGLKKIHILALINIGSRKVKILGTTSTPTKYWMAQKAEELVKYFEKESISVEGLLHDRDPRLLSAFDNVLKHNEIPVIPVTAYSPNLNAYIERWIKSIKEECLNHYIVFGERHLKYLIDEYVSYYNTLRPHQGVGNKVLSLQISALEPDENNLKNVIRESRLGGLLKHYCHAA